MIISESYGSERWRLPPPIEGDWVELDREDAGLLVGRLAEAGRTASPIRVEAVRLARLDFYEGWMLCDIQTTVVEAQPTPDAGADPEKTQAAEPIVSSYLFGPDGFTPLAGLSVPIHEHNLRHGIDISTEDRCKAYLRFFCFFVRGELGPFELHETVDALDTTALADDEKKAGIASLVRPLEESREIAPTGDTQAFRGCVLYGEHLFESHFLVASHGGIEMLNDDLVADGVRRLPPLDFEGNSRFPKAGHANKGENIK